jgi:hypothetical protein
MSVGYLWIHRYPKQNLLEFSKMPEPAGNGVAAALALATQTLQLRREPQSGDVQLVKNHSLMLLSFRNTGPLSV